MAPAALHGVAKVDGGKRPRAFGRTSNVWQYVEAVQERTTPASKYRKRSAVLSQEEEEEDDDDVDRREPDALGGDALHPLTDNARASRHGSTGRATRVGSVGLTRTSQSLTELPPVASVSVKKAPSLLGSPTSLTTTAATPNARKFNASEIVRRIQALGTSASAPQLPLATTPTASVPVSGNQPPPTAAASVALSDAERLRNDFNSQRGKLYFGCSVAFELFNGHLLTVRSPDGAVGVQPLDALQLKSTGGRDRAVFTLVDLADVRSASAIRFGDAVWLQLSAGAGETSWELGGVLGAKVREAPQLQALALADDAAIRNEAQAPLVVGHPVPVRAYLPKNRDDVDAQVDEIQSRVRNKSSKMLGKWILRSALQREGGSGGTGSRRRRSADDFVYNTDEIYLEQDWFYLGADSDQGVAVLRQLPAASSLKDLAVGEYVVERRGAWRLRLLDSSNGSAGLSLAQLQMEKLLLRAKTQLKQSRKMRAGQTRHHGGAAFVTHLRRQLGETTRECDALYAAAQERRLSRLPQHLSSKAELLLSEEQQQWGGDHTSVVTSASRPPSAALSASPVSSSRASTARSTTKKASVTTADCTEVVCGLCKSPSVGYNLCCQIHDVMSALHREREEAHAALATAKVTAHSHSHSHSQRPSHGGAPPARTTSSESAGTPPSLPLTTRATSASHQPQDDTAASRRQTAVASVSSPPPLTTPVLLTGSGGASRLLTLFSQQDQQLLDVIKFKEKSLDAQRAAEAHARIGLSSVTAHFRDRFKHVDMLVQQHTHDVGIGGHFQRLHAELKREETERRETQQRATASKPRRAVRYLQMLKKQQAAAADGAEGDQEEDQFLDVFSLIDMTTQCPLEYPGDGTDVCAQPLPVEHQPRHSKTHARLFPTPDEMDKLPPIDTTLALALYLHNKQAVVEMLDGFVDLTATHIVPNLESAMDARNRGALVEFLDFCARAAEFVYARRVQVRVAQLLHAVAAANVGDFDSFAREYNELLEELEATAAFVGFYRNKVGVQKKNKHKLTSGTRDVGL